MNDRRRIEERIKKKDMEIQGLETQIREAKAYVQALQDVLKMFPKEIGQEYRESQTTTAALRTGSNVARAREAILTEGRPLHISELLQRIGKERSKKARISLSGSLAAYVRRSEIFTRPAPNTFGLVDLDHNSNSAEPPADFGVEEDTSAPPR